MMVLPDLNLLGVGLIAWILVGYILGSIPFGVVLARLMGLGNLREIGSGNIGATNVLRTGSKKAAALTLILDGGKGAFAVFIAQAFAGEAAAQITALSAMLGHCYPVWLGFRGGKGVATVLGVFVALNLAIGAACCATWLVVAAAMRLSSLSALTAVASSFFWSVVFEQPSFVALSILLSILVFWRHRENIQRLMAGTEPKIGQKG
jgi:glycerol-3-phosphate acyltransferase PlsY